MEVFAESVVCLPRIVPPKAPEATKYTTAESDIAVVVTESGIKVLVTVTVAVSPTVTDAEAALRVSVSVVKFLAFAGVKPMRPIPSAEIATSAIRLNVLLDI